MLRAATMLLTALLTATLLSGSAVHADDNPNKKFLEGVGKLLKKGDAASIAAYFPDKGKIELSLKGIKNGKYRDEQAKSLLATYFKRIEPKEYKLKAVRDSVGKFEMKYKVRADGTEVSGTTWVYFEKEEERYRITGIVEP